MIIVHRQDLLDLNQIYYLNDSGGIQLCLLWREKMYTFT